MLTLRTPVSDASTISRRYAALFRFAAGFADYRQPRAPIVVSPPSALMRFLDASGFDRGALGRRFMTSGAAGADGD